MGEANPPPPTHVQPGAVLLLPKGTDSGLLAGEQRDFMSILDEIFEKIDEAFDQDFDEPMQDEATVPVAKIDPVQIAWKVARADPDPGRYGGQTHRRRVQ